MKQNTSTAPGLAATASTDEILDKVETAERLKISTRTLDEWMRAGQVPFLKIGKTALWRQMNDFERLVHHLVHNRGMEQTKAEEFAKRRLGVEDEMKKLKDARREIEVLAARSQQAISQERATLARQRRASGNSQRKPLKEVEGSFGKFES